VDDAALPYPLHNKDFSTELWIDFLHYHLLDHAAEMKPNQTKYSSDASEITFRSEPHFCQAQ